MLNIFFGCSGLLSVTIPNSVTRIGSNAFRSCSCLTSIAVESGNAKYDSRDNCNAIIETSTNTLVVGCKNTVIPNSVTNIGSSAFFGCSGLTSVTIPNSVTSVGAYAFQGCSGLTTITIPSSVSRIDGFAFAYCNDLTSFVVEWETPLTISSSVFWGNYYNQIPTLYVPKGTKSAYQVVDVWKDFKAIKEYPDTDVNQDGVTDVVDVVDIARYVVATPSESFKVFLADLNNDKTVNVADAVVLVNDIAGNTNWSRCMLVPQDTRNDVLTLIESSDHSLSLQFDGDGRYTAFQFDLLLPTSMDVIQMKLNSQRKQSHQLLYNKFDEGHYRVVALSTSNREFCGTFGELLNIVPDGFATDGIVVDNIHFITAQGADLPFDAISLSKEGATTGIADTSGGSGVQLTLYNLNGQQLTTPQKGLNIINGKKVMNK